jgi:hypothetical protein
MQDMHNEEVNRIQLQLESSNAEYDRLKKAAETLLKRVEVANASGAKISLDDMPNGVYSCANVCVYVCMLTCQDCPCMWR